MLTSAQSCPTLCESMDCSPPGSSVHGILQARLLEWVAMTHSGIKPTSLTSPASADGFFTTNAPRACRGPIHSSLSLLWASGSHYHSFSCSPDQPPPNPFPRLKKTPPAHLVAILQQQPLGVHPHSPQAPAPFTRAAFRDQGAGIPHSPLGPG